MKKIYLVFIITNLLFLSISCSDQKNETSTNLNSDKLIEITNQWMSPAARNRNSAVYFTITNNTENTDTLYEAVSELAQITELHETYKISEDMLGMRTIKLVVIPPNSTFDFSPGGFHVMLVGLKNHLPINASGDITLKFKKAGDVKISAVSQISQD